MTSRNRPVHGTRPWPGSTTGEVPYEQPAPRQHAPYVCERGHRFAVTFAAEVTAPAVWACRCGAPAGTAEPAGGESEHERRMAQLFGRRTRGELEELLAGRLTEIRGTTQ